MRLDQFQFGHSFPSAVPDLLSLSRHRDLAIEYSLNEKPILQAPFRKMLVQLAPLTMKPHASLFESIGMLTVPVDPERMRARGDALRNELAGAVRLAARVAAEHFGWDPVPFIERVAAAIDAPAPLRVFPPRCRLRDGRRKFSVDLGADLDVETMRVFLRIVQERAGRTREVELIPATERICPAEWALGSSKCVLEDGDWWLLGRGDEVLRRVRYLDAS